MIIAVTICRSDSSVHSSAAICLLFLSHLFVQELPRVFLYVSFIQVCGQTH